MQEICAIVRFRIFCYIGCMKSAPHYTVIHSDSSIVVLNKRSGLLVAADRYDTDALRLDVLAEQEFGRLFAVHRIDKDTSGIVVYARTEDAHRALSVQFERRQVRKCYHALVNGRPLWQSLRVDVPLLPDGDQRHRSVPNRRFGKPAITNLRLLGVCGQYSWLEASPLTGRTHQIRAHVQYAGLGIVCDPLYSGNQKPLRLSEIKRSWHGNQEEERPLLARLGLHAYRLAFAHPSSNETVQFTAPYQKDLDSARKQLAKLYGIDPIAQEQA